MLTITKMVEKIIKSLQIPEGVNLDISGNQVSANYNGNSLVKNFKCEGIEIKKDASLFEVSSKKNNKKQAKMIGTIIAHVKNMMNGLKESFVYKLEICNVHFPVTVKIEGSKLKIKNFLGENIEREAKIIKNVNIEVKGNEITLKSFDKEAVGQTAANIEQATLIKFRDRRVFQDGIFLTERAGKLI